MTVLEIRTAEGRFRPAPGVHPPSVAALLRAAILCTPEDGEGRGPEGDALAEALERAAEAAGVEVEEERLFNPRLDTLASGAPRPLLATLHLNPFEGQAIYLRGAADGVAERCGSWFGGAPLDPAEVRAAEAEMEAAGMRVVAVAARVPDRALPRLDDAAVAEGCALHGLVGLAVPEPG